MKCFHSGHSFPPYTTVIFNLGDWTPSKLSLLHNLVELSPPREDYHLSLTTLEDYHPLERIITSLSLPWGIITPWTGLSPLSRYPGGLLTPHLSNHYPGGLPTPTQSDLSCPFPHNYSGSVVYFHSKGYGLGTLMARNCTKKNNSLALLLRPHCERLKGISRYTIIVNQPTAQPSIFHPTKFGIIITLCALSR